MEQLQLSKEHLLEIYGGDREVMLAVFTDLLTSLPQMQQALVSAYEAGDLSVLEKELHSIAPGFSYVGAPQLSVEAKELMVQCREVSHKEELGQRFAAFMHQTELCKQACNAELLQLQQENLRA